jgi:DNA-binding transcriptional regulator YiaG
MTKPRSRPAFTPHLTPVTRIVQPDAMSADEFNDLLRRLKLSQSAAARLLGVNGRTVRRWATGDTPILPVAARFVRFLARAKISPITVMETLGS